MISDHYAGLACWKAAPEDIQAASREILHRLVDEHGVALVATFYSAFLDHEEGRSFLNHDVVHNRLSGAMVNWLKQLVSVDLAGDLTEFSAHQAKVGAIHGRMKVPNHLVQQGASLMKSQLSGLITKAALDQPYLMAQTIIIFDELMDFALCLMGKAYVTDAQERAQVDEAFRHFSLGQDINLERETQRSALLEWSQATLFNLFGNRKSKQVQKLAASPFGFWMRHRAAVLFQDISALAAIERAIVDVDMTCLPAVQKTDEDSSALMALKEKIEEIDYLLSHLFQAAASIENGRDPLTRTLSRRFLPAVLNREIMMAKSHELPLCVAMVDLDHFKSVNDQFGHGVGDLALCHVADILLKSVRGNDFVFRYGGEEFLVVFPETTAEAAIAIMDRLRQKLEQAPVNAGEHGDIKITLSAGVAAFEGHPDYEYLIRNADSALYDAKGGGRNRVSLKS